MGEKKMVIVGPNARKTAALRKAAEELGYTVEELETVDDEILIEGLPTWDESTVLIDEPTEMMPSSHGPVKGPKGGKGKSRHRWNPKGF